MVIFALMQFVCEHTDSDSQARAGTLTTDHGVIQTPIFMPVGTQATVKGVLQRDLEDDVNPRRQYVCVGNWVSG